MAIQLRRFTDEQIERAKRIDVVEYARSQGLEIEKRGNWHRAKHQGGLYFDRRKNIWHWETHNAGGIGAISLCMEFEGKTFIEAVKTLLNEDMEPIRHAPDWKPEPEPPREFRLPNKNDTYRHVFAYLTKTRGIDPGILKTMVDRGYIYENTQYSCVFVGKDKDGVAKHASVRSTNTYGKVYKQDVPGSQKAYSFSISGISGTLNVFEAPIDALSYMSMQKLYGKQLKDSYVALGGVTDRALERFLADHNDISKIRICTDNDPYLNPIWDLENMPERGEMKIEKTNKIMELDDAVIFRTYNDYSRFIAKNENPDIHCVVFPKDQLTFFKESDLYSINITADQEYTLYDSPDDYFKGAAGTKISGNQLYNRHFFKMPAGERAAFSINEKYAGNYIITRHRPMNKDFNEDLVALRKQQRDKERSQSRSNEQNRSGNKEQQEKKTADRRISETVKQTVPENSGQMKAENLVSVKEVLQQAGVSQKVISWYQNQSNAMPLSTEHFQIQGTSEKLFICENPIEVFSVLELRMRIYQQQYGKDNYVSNDNYLVYSDIRQFNQYMQENNPRIKEIYLCGGQTEGGQRLNRDIMEQKGHFNEQSMLYCRPNMKTYAEELALSNAVEAAVEQSPIEQQPDMAVGMEM